MECLVQWLPEKHNKPGTGLQISCTDNHIDVPGNEVLYFLVILDSDDTSFI
jgi:hypothetical protein